MKSELIVNEIEQQNEKIWEIIRAIHEGDEMSVEEIKEKLIFISGNLVAELLIPLQDSINKDL